MSGALSAADVDRAREQARRILAGNRYTDAKVRRPMQRPLSFLGRQIEQFFRWLGTFFDAAIPGSGLVQWVILGALVVVGLVWLSRLQVQRRRRVVRGPEGSSVDADALDAEADAAERGGDLRRALELRFRAGIARLDQASVGASTRTNRQIEPAVVSPFGPLAQTFDAAHYGDVPVTAEQVATARRDWPSVVMATRQQATSSVKKRRLRRGLQ